ncbi:MAG: hypothetical protein ABH827_04575 [bacterium]
MNKRLGIIIGGTVVAVTLTVLPGCKMFDVFKKDKGETSTAGQDDKKGPLLLSINNEAVLWENDFKKSLTQMLQANPYFRGAGIEALPTAIKKRFFDELVKQELILDAAKKQDVAKRAEFVKAYDELKKLAKRSLIIQFYEKDIYEAIEVNDKEKDKFFEENKEKFVKTAGGIMASGVRCANEAEATALVKEVQSAGILSNEKECMTGFEKIAKKNAGAKFKNFGRVSGKGGEMGEAVPAPISEAVLALKKLPAVEKVKVGKDVWVVAAADKQDAVFFERAEIDSQVVNILKNNKFREELDKKIKDLRSTAKLNINEVYFKEEAQKQPKSAEEMVEVAKGDIQEVVAEASAEKAPEASEAPAANA